MQQIRIQCFHLRKSRACVVKNDQATLRHDRTVVVEAGLKIQNDIDREDDGRRP